MTVRMTIFSNKIYILEFIPDKWHISHSNAEEFLVDTYTKNVSAQLVKHDYDVTTPSHVSIRYSIPHYEYPEGIGIRREISFVYPISHQTRTFPNNKWFSIQFVTHTRKQTSSKIYSST